MNRALRGPHVTAARNVKWQKDAHNALWPLQQRVTSLVYMPRADLSLWVTFKIKVWNYLHLRTPNSMALSSQTFPVGILADFAQSLIDIVSCVAAEWLHFHLLKDVPFSKLQPDMTWHLFQASLSLLLLLCFDVSVTLTVVLPAGSLWS